MRIAVSGSIATDHLMTFAGKFTDTLIAEKLDKISVSFLVGDLEIRRGGVAGNISYGLGCLGLKPLLVGCVGPDFAEYACLARRRTAWTPPACAPRRPGTPRASPPPTTSRATRSPRSTRAR